MKISVNPAVVAPILAGVYSAWNKTVRYEGQNWEYVLELIAEKEPIIFSLWHGELFPVTWYGSTLIDNIVIFISQSKDGEVISKVVENMGHKTVRGSSSRGGVRALLQAKRLMDRENRKAVLTIDGPRGPRHKPKDGIIYLAHRTKAKIIPLRAYSEKAKVFDKSWDKFTIPYPFSKCTVCVGEPMTVTTEKLDKDMLKHEKDRLERHMLDTKPR